MGNEILPYSVLLIDIASIAFGELNSGSLFFAAERLISGRDAACHVGITARPFFTRQSGHEPIQERGNTYSDRDG
jgi:hypothetical protein